MDNTVTLVGNVTRDPEIRYTPSGQTVATFGLAVNRRWQNRQNNEWEEQVSFFDVKCWSQMAENVSESVQQGHPCHRHRPPRAALLGDRQRRQAIQDRGGGRRGRPQPAVGNRPGQPRSSAARPVAAAAQAAQRRAVDRVANEPANYDGEEPF